MKKSTKLNEYILISILYLYIIILFYLALGEKVLYWSDLSLKEYIIGSTNLIPFKTIFYYIQCIFNQTINLDIIVYNLLAPIISFSPLGFFLPFFIKKDKKYKLTLFYSFIISFFIETVQVIFRRGSFDIDDIFSNILGISLGYIIFKFLINSKLYNTFKKEN